MSTNNLKDILIAEGILERQLSQVADVSISTINRISNRRRTCSPKTQNKIVKGLNNLYGVGKYTLEDVFPQ